MISRCTNLPVFFSHRIVPETFIMVTAVSDPWEGTFSTLVHPRRHFRQGTVSTLVHPREKYCSDCSVQPLHPQYNLYRGTYETATWY